MPRLAHRATQQLRPPAYFKAAYAITRQELATLISDSRHTTPGLRLGVAFAMSSHVTDATRIEMKLDKWRANDDNNRFWYGVPLKSKGDYAF